MASVRGVSKTHALRGLSQQIKAAGFSDPTRASGSPLASRQATRPAVTPWSQPYPNSATTITISSTKPSPPLG